MFTKATLLSCLAAATLSSAAPTTKRDDLQPWEINSLGVFTPSGRPGSYPWSTITANITDPNEITGTLESGDTVTIPGGNTAANCQAKWYSGTTPTGRVWPCDPTEDGYWIVEIMDGDDGFSSTNFDIKFTRVIDGIYSGQRFTKTFEGSTHMAVGDNLQGTCGGSGVCSWGLKEENRPAPVTQTEVSDE
ncbi:cell death in tomato 1 [Lojkania enalia]|uniref:Cell death in tomato 1 n=1 Tax=Lojkania enalia TaxID=147567 RepID=A0A9P4N4V6_9PLEO|nr:cell death in tomato 1 [Didymosphaeria enalia]